MPETPPSEQAASDAGADALDAVEQAGVRAQELADELAGGFDDIDAVRAAAPAGVDAIGDLDAVLAAGVDWALDGGFELTDLAAPAHAPAPEPEPVAAAPTQAAVSDELDELAGGAFVNPAALSDAVEPKSESESEPGAADSADLADPADEADAFAAALAESVLADAPEPEPAAADAADDAGDEADAFAAALAESVLADVADPEPQPEGEDPSPAGDAAPPVNPERIQDAIAEMEALLAAADAADAADAAATPPPLPADTLGGAQAQEDPAAAGGGAADGEDELAGLFAAPEIPSASDAAGAPPVVRALSDEHDEVPSAAGAGETADPSAPPVHPDAAAANAEAASDADAQAAAGGLFPLGWLKALLALIHRPFGQMSDTLRLTLSGVALAVAIPGALLLCYALLLK